MNAPERTVELERIELEIEVQPGKGAAVIDSLQVDRFTYRPGERIEATVQVRTRDGNVETYRTSLRLPADMMPGRYMLQVSAGGGGAPTGATGLLLLGEGAFGGGWGRHRSATARVPQPRAQLPDDRRAEPAVPDHQR
jgi:hypothetical protein